MEKERGSLNVWTESAHLVKTLLEERHRQPEETLDKEATPGLENTEVETINWVTSRDFTVALGEQQIGDYIKTWSLAPRWLYSLHFLRSTEQENHIFHHYQARFSAPSSERPVRGTASVHFVVDVSKIRPQTLPVEVHFVVESTRLVHTAGTTRFTEKWLVDVIESKALLGREVDL